MTTLFIITNKDPTSDILLKQKELQLMAKPRNVDLHKAVMSNILNNIIKMDILKNITFLNFTLWDRCHWFLLLDLCGCSLAHKSVHMFVSEVTGLITGQPLNTVASNRQRERGHMRNESNYLYHPSSCSFKSYIKTQSVHQNTTCQSLPMCVKEWMHLCSHKKWEAQIADIILRLAAGKSLKYGTTGVNF